MKRIEKNRKAIPSGVIGVKNDNGIPTPPLLICRLLYSGSPLVGQFEIK